MPFGGEARCEPGWEAEAPGPPKPLPVDLTMSKIEARLDVRKSGSPDSPDFGA